MKLWAICALLAALSGTLAPVRATPIVPTRDDEVIDVLPAVKGSRAEERRLRRQLAHQPRDPALALAVAKRYLDQAHELGDPRFAGMAMSAIEAWTDEATMPDAVLMMRATLQQYLHEFDASVASLQHLLARPGGQPRPQSWLTLATVRRVQGRYADSDAACRQVASAGAALHASACLAENAALRGDVAGGRSAFVALLASVGNPPATQAWLSTSLAELEQRAGNPAAAEAAFRAALKLDPDGYTTLAFADFLIEQKRPAQARALLKDQARSDAVLLRLAIAGTQARAATAAADVAEMRERIALANERPDAKVFHGREQAMFALAVDRDAARALELARGNVAQQREPLDLLVLAQAARATGQAAALQEAKRLTVEIGLVDQRIKAIL
ncbi:MAG: tetratricopeptide repeat protein [Burkholderiaceae bacterium]